MALKVLMYSFKGGAGRTVSTANIARLLAVESGRRVAAIDLDVESAGLSVLFKVDRKVETGECGTIQDILRGFFQNKKSVTAEERPDDAQGEDLLDKKTTAVREETTVSFARPKLPEVWNRIHLPSSHSDRLTIVPSRRILDSRREGGPNRETGRRFGDFLINLQAWSEGPEII